jgi:hypothetical protein
MSGSISGGVLSAAVRCRQTILMGPLEVPKSASRDCLQRMAHKPTRFELFSRLA